MFVRLLFLIALTLPSGAQADTQSPDLAGHYYLSAMEMGSELLLKPDKSFEVIIAYGGAEGHAKGTWDVIGKTLTLKNDAVVPPPTELLFGFGGAYSLAELEVPQQPGGGERFKQAQNNYVLKLSYSRPRNIPAIKPVTVQFEFDQGPPSRWLWDDAQEHKHYLPFSEQRTLTKIGLRMGDASQATQWFAVASTTRDISIEWKVDRATDRLVYEKPTEIGLDESRHYSRDYPDDLALIDKNYLIALYYGVPAVPPVITPVDVFWSFEDGSVEKQVWNDATQKQLTVPVEAGKTLKKVGVKLRSTDGDMEWFEVKDGGRVVYLNWEEGINTATAGDLSSIFTELDLEVKRGCLAVDFGNGVACYRKAG